MRLAEVDFSHHDRSVVASVTGEIDLSNVETLRAALTEGTPNHAMALVLDLTSIEYLDSSGIQLIYRLREDLRVRGQSLWLVIPSDSPANAALRLAGVENHVPTKGSVPDALEEVSSSEQ
jgi:anti-anti-sigma factor